MPEVHYQVVDLAGISVRQQQKELEDLGENQWILVAVDEQKAYLRKILGEGEANPVDYGQSTDDEDNEWMPKDATEKLQKLETSQDAGPGSPLHRHRVRVLVKYDAKEGLCVIKGETDNVAGHTHAVNIYGVTEEADGHVHRFGGDELGEPGVGTFEYDG